MKRSMLAGMLGGAAAIVGSARLHGQTVNEAKAFYTEFDEATLFGRGPVTKEVYGGGDTPEDLATRRLKIGRDIFDNFSSNADKAIDVLIYDAHGKKNQKIQDQEKEVNEKWTKLKTDGVLKRLSDLQLKIVNKHFKKVDGSIDFDKFQRATEMFANGELRPGNEMNQLWQWVTWKKFAEVAIQKDIDKAKWESMLKSLETGLEIMRVVYPSPAAVTNNDLRGELVGSKPATFDMTKQRTAQQKTDLRNAIAALDTNKILERQKGLIKDMTPKTATAMAPTKTLDAAVASLDPALNGYQVVLEMLLTDELGVPDNTGDLLVRVYGGGLVLDESGYYAELSASLEGDGVYRATFLWPALSLDAVGFVAVVGDLNSGAFNTTAASVPEPASALLALSVVALLARRRVFGFNMPPA